MEIRKTACLAWALALLTACGPAAAPDYQTVYPDIGTVETLVEDTGTVAYRDPYTILPVVSGKILSCSFEEGDAVTAGQVLYTIDAAGLEDQITQARLNLKSAAESAAQSAAACEDLTVTASASGTVTALYVHVGDYVDVGSPIADVVDSAQLILTVPFAKGDAAAMAPGSPAVIAFPGQSGQLSGSVKRVYDTSSPIQGGREGVFVEIALQNPGTLASGAAATASVGSASCMEAGTVRNGTEQSLYATQAGQVLTLPMEVGQAVAQGQVVMTIENAALTNASVNAQLAQESAAVALDLLTAKRGDYTILAPVDGIITLRGAKAGDYASAASPMATLVEPGAMCVNAEIDEIYIDRVWPGQEAQVSFTTDGGEMRTYPAAVRRVDDTGITSGGVTDYTVELDLEDLDGLKAGMNVSVRIVSQRKEGCLRLPSAAVSGGAVQVLRDGKAVEAEVVTGISGGGYTEILSGVGVGDAVILP